MISCQVCKISNGVHIIQYKNFCHLSPTSIVKVREPLHRLRLLILCIQTDLGKFTCQGVRALSINRNIIRLLQTLLEVQR